ncbi:LOW QUALITY PROTEIN: hypothetical protein ACHAXR_001276, partial [Thalassiosira sp. AJA248-18]
WRLQPCRKCPVSGFSSLVASLLLTTCILFSPEQWVSGLDTATGAHFRETLGAAQKAVSNEVSSGRAQTTIRAWEKWLDFTDELGINPFLEAFQDKVPIQQVFIDSQRRTCSQQESNQVSIGLKIAYGALHRRSLQLGPMINDPRLNLAGKNDFHIKRMYDALKKMDPPSNRGKPIPIEVIRRIAYIAANLPPDAYPSKPQQT